MTKARYVVCRSPSFWVCPTIHRPECHHLRRPASRRIEVEVDDLGDHGANVRAINAKRWAAHRPGDNTLVNPCGSCLRGVDA